MFCPADFWEKNEQAQGDKFMLFRASCGTVLANGMRQLPGNK